MADVVYLILSLNGNEVFTMCLTVERLTVSCDFEMIGLTVECLITGLTVWGFFNVCVVSISSANNKRYNQRQGKIFELLEWLKKN